jgi:hypothetical protein
MPVLVAVASGIVLFAYGVDPRLQAPSADVDPSWHAVLGWALRHNLQWGSDIVFTYGPFGFLSPTATFDPTLYPAWVAINIAMSAILAALAANAVRRIPFAYGLVFLCASIVMGGLWVRAVAWLLSYPLALLALIQCDAMRRPSRWIPAIAALAFVEVQWPLIKFVSFPLWCLWLVAGCLVLRRRAGPVALFLAMSIAGEVLIWILCGQSLVNIPAYLVGSLDLALNYGQAMQLQVLPAFADALALVALLGGIVYLCSLGSRTRHAHGWVLAALSVATLGLSYRSSMLRGDTHEIAFWCMLALMLPLAAGLAGARAAEHKHAWIGALTSCVVPLGMTATLAISPAGAAALAHTIRPSQVIQNPINLLRLPQVWREELSSYHAALAKLALPNIAQRVGRGTVDMLMNAQGWIIANDLNYDPRPVFQSYSAYSVRLAQRNGKFYASNKAPAWVILNWNTMNERFPAGDDPLSLIRVLQDYEPVLEEHDNLLLRRKRNVPPGIRSQPSHALAVDFNSAIALPPTPAAAWFVRLDVGLTTWGKIAALLFRPPRLMIAVTLRDGTTLTYALVRAIAQSGFMLSPALDSNATYLDWLQGKNEREVAKVELLQQRFLGHDMFQANGPLLLYPLARPRNLAPTLAMYADTYPGFDHMPVATSEPTRNYQVDGQPVMFLPAPGFLTFDLPPGTWTVHATYGVMPNALTDPTCRAAKPDGIGIRVDVAGEDIGPSAVAYLDPFGDPHHRYRAEYSRTLVVGTGKRVTVSLTVGPKHDGGCDWSWIRDVRFTPSRNSGPA